MRKSELLAIKKKEYERGLSDAKLTISNRDVEEWAGKITPDIFKEQAVRLGAISLTKDLLIFLLREIGVTIYPATSNVVDKEE